MSESETETFIVHVTNNYTYDEETLIGKWMERDMKIMVRTGCTESDYRTAFYISHPNHLECLFINKKEGHMIFECAEKLLRDYVENWENSVYGHTRVMTTRLPSLPPAADNFIEYHHLHPIIKDMCLQMFTFVFDVHVEGLSLNHFALSDLRVNDSGIVKFCIAGKSASNTDHDARRNDFVCLKNVITELVGDDNVQKLPDLQHLFSMINGRIDGKDWLQGKWVLTHLSIADSKYVRRFLLNCKIKVQRSPYDEALDEVATHEQWAEDILRDPKCWFVRQYYEHGGNAYEQFGTNRARTVAVLHFAAYMMETEHFNAPFNGYVLSAEKMQSVIMSVFSSQILDAQFGLFKHGKLDKFMELETEDSFDE